MPLRTVNTDRRVTLWSASHARRDCRLPDGNGARGIFFAENGREALFYSCFVLFFPPSSSRQRRMLPASRV